MLPGLMSPETLAKSLTRLIGESKALRESATEHRRDAAATRASVAAHVRRSPARRMARLAQGGRDRDGDGNGSAPDGMLVETRDRCCPFCQAVSIKLVGKVEAEDGQVKSHRQCFVCGRAFVYVRKALGFLGSPQNPRDLLK